MHERQECESRIAASSPLMSYRFGPEAVKVTLNGTKSSPQSEPKAARRDAGVLDNVVENVLPIILLININREL